MALTRGRSAFCAPEPSALSRSTHDFASGGSSPSGTRLRLPRSACVESEGSRPFPSTLGERGDLSRSETPSFVTASLFVQSGSPRVSSDDARVVHPLLALRFACARGGQEMFDAEVCNLIRRAGTTVVRARCPFPASDRRPMRVRWLFPFGRLTWESHVDLRRRPGRVLRRVRTSLYALSAFRDRTGSCFEPASPVPRGEKNAGLPRGAAYVSGARRYFISRRPVPHF